MSFLFNAAGSRRGRARLKHAGILVVSVASLAATAMDVAAQAPVPGTAVTAVGRPAAQAVPLPAALLSALRFVAWPAGAMDTETFVLCYRGAEELDHSLPMLEGRRVQGRSLQLRRLDSPARALACQALYLPADSAERARYIEAVALRPVLTIGDDVDILAAGADMALLPTASRLRPAVNADAVQRSGLRVDARLLRVARRPLPPGPPR